MLVTFCLLLLGTLGVVFTRVVAARVPEQRATLEKLITDRTGLAVRFDNVHFAWNLDGTSAVFERVELTDPKRGRVRVVAPELRVEFDTWDYLRHHQFSLGHVTLASPDIEIIGDAIDVPARAERAPRAARLRAGCRKMKPRWCAASPRGPSSCRTAASRSKARACICKRRGDRAARATFTLSQAMLIRGASTSTHSAPCCCRRMSASRCSCPRSSKGSARRRGVSGDLRLIARRVFLDRLPVIAARGRGTLDAKLQLQDGLVESASWQASARELEFGDDARARFDHLTVNGKLERDAGDFLLRFARPAAHARRAPGACSATDGAAQRRPRYHPHRAHHVAAPSACHSWPRNSCSQLLAPQLEDRVARIAGRLDARRRRAARGAFRFAARDARRLELQRPARRRRLRARRRSRAHRQLARELQLDARESRARFRSGECRPRCASRSAQSRAR